MSVQTISIDKIRIDGGTQQRPLDQDALAEYTQRVVDGSKPPPADVIFDGKEHWLWDGFHRYHAHVKAGQKRIAVNVRKGTQRDAVWLSFSANKSHGVRRQKGVVREIIEAILADPEWAKRKETEIATHVGVSRSYLSEIKGGRYEKKLETQRAHTSVRAEGSSSSQATSAKTDSKPSHRVTTDDAQPAPPDDGDERFINDESGEGGGGDEDGPSFRDEEETGPTDCEGSSIPDRPDLRAAFENAAKFDHALGLIGQITADLTFLFGDAKEKSAAHGGELLSAYRAQVMQDLRNLRQTITPTRPRAVCPYCQGSGEPCRKSRTGCKGLGWVTKQAWEAAPAELRAKSKGEKTAAA